MGASLAAHVPAHVIALEWEWCWWLVGRRSSAGCRGGRLDLTDGVGEGGAGLDRAVEDTCQEDDEDSEMGFNPSRLGVMGCLARKHGDGGVLLVAPWALEMYLHLDLDGRCLDCWRDGFSKMDRAGHGERVNEGRSASSPSCCGRTPADVGGRRLMGFNPSGFGRNCWRDARWFYACMELLVRAETTSLDAGRRRRRWARLGKMMEHHTGAPCSDGVLQTVYLQCINLQFRL
ncbi:hypothetical protein ACLOJK_019193 [Asimina triloba]